MLAAILPSNRFYRSKFGASSLVIESWDQFQKLPLTQKDELSRPDETFAANLTYSASEYSRYHRTSGTKGKPIAILDTAADWNWWVDTWQFVLDAADVSSDDRAVMAFSYGPFIGFWSAHDALAARGTMVIPCGGMDTSSRLDTILCARATVICCTPTYALRMAEVAANEKIDVANSSVSRIIVAGEPGGSIPAVRSRIESAWGARVVDHSGATEVGPWGYPDAHGRGLHVIESEFIAEFVSLKTGQVADDGELSELILTTVNRYGCPVIRYRTGDLVRPRWGNSPANGFVFLEGGVIGRSDDMMIIRGVNIFPSSVEQVLREFPEVGEYRLVASKTGEMDTLSIEVEDDLNAPDRIATELKKRLGLNVSVTNVESGTLPRFEAKGRRFVDNR